MAHGSLSALDTDKPVVSHERERRTTSGRRGSFPLGNQINFAAESPSLAGRRSMTARHTCIVCWSSDFPPSAFLFETRGMANGCGQLPVLGAISEVQRRKARSRREGWLVACAVAPHMERCYAHVFSSTSPLQVTLGKTFTCLGIFPRFCGQAASSRRRWQGLSGPILPLGSSGSCPFAAVLRPVV